MENKKTKIEMMTEIQKALTDKELIAFLEDQKTLIKKKNSKRTLSANQKENVNLKSVILNALDSTPISITDLQAKDTTLSDLSNQRVSALLKQLITEEKVVRVVDKRKSYFAKA